MRKTALSTRRFTIGAALALLVAAPATLLAEDFVVKPGGKNLVKFISKAPMESFEGKTDQVNGKISVRLDGVGDWVTVDLHVDLASLDTGISRRNQHMRENHLETDQFPEAVFSGATVISPASATLVPGKSVTFTIEGDFTLHGVTRRLRTSAGVTAGKDGTLRVKTQFDVALADYDIKRPKFLVLKLNDVQRIVVDLVAVPATPAE